MPMVKSLRADIDRAEGEDIVEMSANGRGEVVGQVAQRRRVDNGRTIKVNRLKRL